MKPFMKPFMNFLVVFPALGSPARPPTTGDRAPVDSE
jgi:hypothetical protein